MCRRVFLLGLALVLAACQAALPSPTSTPLPTPTPFPNDFIGKAQVGENQMSIICKGTGEPTIILENGLDYPSWMDNQFYKITRTCTYPRLGTVGSPIISGSRTTLDQVKDLHSILEQTGIPGPYILVGHSIAGYNLLVYTDQYPEEVVGMVCADCRPPEFENFVLKNLIEEDFFPTTEQALAELESGYWQNPASMERLDVNASNAQVLQVKTLGDRPFVVLVADDKDVLGMDFGHRTFDIEDSFMEAVEKLSQLSTQGRVEIVPNTNHLNITLNDAVIQAVQEVYDKVTNP